MTVTTAAPPAPAPETQAVHGDRQRQRRLALVASKGTLDGAYPALILATTAASLGWEVAIFFTFYGLDIIHKKKHKKLKVSPLANPAMPIALPSLVGALPGMTAAATAMMKGWMKRSRMPGVGEFLDMARESGVRLYACSTTMGVMGIGPEDLLADADIAGATAFLDFAADADVSLFV